MATQIPKKPKAAQQYDLASIGRRALPVEGILSADIAQVDLFTDINDQFFARSNKIVRILVGLKRKYEASNLKKCIDLIAKYQHKCLELARENESMKSDMGMAEERFQLAIELVQNVHECLAYLKSELAEAWQMADMATNREQATQELLQKLQGRFDDKHGYLSEPMDEAKEFGSLAPYKKMILRERDRLSAEVNDLERRLEMNRYYAEALEQMTESKAETITTLRRKIDDVRRDRSDLERKLGTMTIEFEEAQILLAEVQKKLESTEREVAATKSKLYQKSVAFSKMRSANVKLYYENDARKKEVERLEFQVQSLSKDVGRYDLLVKAMKLEDAAKARTISNLYHSQRRILEDKRNLNRRVELLTKKIYHLDSHIMQYKNEIAAVNKDVHVQMVRYDDLTEAKENLAKQREGLLSTIAKMNNTMNQMKHSETIKKNTIETQKLYLSKLNQKIDMMGKEMEKAHREYREVVQERASLENRLDQYKEQLQYKTETVKELNLKLNATYNKAFALKKQLDETHTKAWELEHQVSSLTQERDKMKKQTAIYEHTTEQLSSAIQKNQKHIESLKKHIGSLEIEKRHLKGEFNRQTESLDNARIELKSIKTYNVYLQRTIEEDDKKLKEMSIKLEGATTQKNLIGSTLARRNDEIVQLRDKVQMQEIAIKVGTKAYNQRLADIDLLKKEISHLTQKCQLLENSIKNSADLRMCVVRTYRALIQEQVKVRDLTEEINAPTNVHRWRVLKGEDPTRYQLIQELQTMKKLCAKQKEEKMKLQRRVASLQSTVSSFKSMISKLPSQRKLLETEYMNRKLTKRCKALTAEHEVDRMTIMENEAFYSQLNDLIRAAQNASNAESSSANEYHRAAVIEETSSFYAIN